MPEYKGYKDLIVYQKSYNLAMEIFEFTKSFPVEERYSLTDQIRRSSRAVPANISSAWVRRKYPKHFVSKLMDALPTTYYLLPTTYYLLPTTYCLLPTAYSKEHSLIFLK